MYCQVWWPILEIGALHLTHPSAHTQQWTHTLWTRTRSSGKPLLQRPGSNWGFGALLKGTSVMVLKVERVLFIHNPCRTWDSNPQPLDYKSDSNHLATTSPVIFNDFNASLLNKNIK